MNNPGSSESEAAPDPDAPPSPPASGPDLRAWLRRLLVCNPFFLGSAALLLFGVNRLSTEDRLFTSDLQNLLFNFFSLQAYEVALILTALFLARRRIWYDSALLVVLEHSLVLVPFVLISHASLESLGLAWTLILAGVGLIVARFVGIRRGYPDFNLSGRAALLGAGLLIANIALPLIARPTLDRDVLDWEGPNRLLWLYILPIVVVGANLLPRPERWRHGGPGPGRPWLPLMIYGLWTVGSVVHVWSIAHICGLPVHRHELAPLLLAAAWTLNLRLTDCLAHPTSRHRALGLLVTAPVPLLAYGHPEVFLPLTALNLLVHLTLCLDRSANREVRNTARQLAMSTFALLLSGVPANWVAPLLGPVTNAQIIAVAGGAYLVLQAAWSRRPEMAVLGAGALGLIAAGLFRQHGPHLAVQASLVFLLLHSLRWTDAHPPGAEIIRWLGAAGWVLESILAARLTGPIDGVALGAAALVLVSWGLRWWHTLEPQALFLALAAMVVAVAAPANWARQMAQQHTSPGLNALAASFALLALGAVVALRRHRSRRST